MSQINVTNIREIQEAVRSHTGLLPKGGGTKPALSTSANGASTLNLSGLSNILEYQPNEYTFTALAGTPVAEVENALAEHGQYLPFEPPLAKQGATVGGTVAAGLSGSARYRYGGVRDFLIGLRFVDGHGQLVTGGGKVVKNAAGFDLPKLMVGSLGRYGILTEVSFKVFPAPRSFLTLVLPYDSLADGVNAVRDLTTAPYDIEALDLVPHADGANMEVRLGGIDDVLPERANRILDHLGVDGASKQLHGEEETLHWQSTRDFAWANIGGSSRYLIKVPTTPRKVIDLDKRLADHAGPRRYCVGGNLSWLAWSDDLSELHQLLGDLGMSGLVVLGNAEEPMIGMRTGQHFAQRIKAALDPDARFYGGI